MHQERILTTDDLEGQSHMSFLFRPAWFQKSDTSYGRHFYFGKNYSHRIPNNHGRHATKADTNVTQLCFSNSDSYRPFKNSGTVIVGRAPRTDTDVAHTVVHVARPKGSVTLVFSRSSSMVSKIRRKLQSIVHQERIQTWQNLESQSHVTQT